MKKATTISFAISEENKKVLQEMAKEKEWSLSYICNKIIENEISKKKEK